MNYLRSKLFYSLLIILSLGALFLRVHDYAVVPPFAELYDEQHYAFGGLTWLTSGTPKSWSWYETFTDTQMIERHGMPWKIKSPMIEKPFLYFLASGASLLPFYKADPYITDLTLIRLLPLGLSFITLLLVGLVGRKLFNPLVGIVALLIYAVTPTIVLSNRLSVTENLLIPLSLLAVLLLLHDEKGTRRNALLLGVLSVLAVLTKQIGAFVGFAAMIHYAFRKNIAGVVMIGCSIAVGIFIYFGFVYLYDGPLYWKLQNEIQKGHALRGLPESFVNIVTHPTISEKNRTFADTTMLLGYLLLFTSPFWLKKEGDEQNITTFIAFPLMYLLLFVIGQSGSVPYTYWGWYSFPFFPFIAIVLAQLFYRLWQRPAFLEYLIVVIALGSGQIRFLLAQFMEYQKYWQWMLIFLIASLILSFILPGKNRPRAYLLVFFLLFIVLSAYNSWHLTTLYQLVISGK